MPEETSQGTAEETSQEVQTEEVQGQTESNAATEESQPTADEIAKWKQDSVDYAEANKKITEQGQSNAALQERVRQYDAYYANEAEKAKQATAVNDPLAEMRVAQGKALLDGDDTAYNAAGRRYEEALQVKSDERTRQLVQQGQHDILAVIDTQRHAEGLGVSRDQMAQVARDLGVTKVTPENAAHLAKYAAIANGTYDASQERAKAAADRQSQMDTFLTSGAQGGARGPGMASMTPETPQQEYHPFKMVEFLDSNGENVRPGQEQAAKDYLATVSPEEIPERFRNI